MTEDERNNGIGKLVRGYNDNEEELAILKDKLDKLSTFFLRLGDWLKRPDQIVAHKTGDSAVFEDGQQRTEVNLNEVVDALNKYTDALNEKEKMENKLRQAGLAKLIQ